MKAMSEELDRIRRAVMGRPDADTRDQLTDLIDVISAIEQQLTAVEKKADHAYENSGGFRD